MNGINLYINTDNWKHARDSRIQPLTSTKTIHQARKEENEAPLVSLGQFINLAHCQLLDN
jgi:hypothetical protein